MSMISKYIETHPLNGMKNHQTQSETQVINDRNWIGYQLFHDY